MTEPISLSFLFFYFESIHFINWFLGLWIFLDTKKQQDWVRFNAVRGANFKDRCVLSLDE